MNRRRKVYVVNKSCHDFSEAERFGELVLMSDGYYNQLSTGKMFRDFSDALKSSSPLDYIIPCGRRIMSNVACAMFASMHKRLNLLIWISSKDREGEFIPGRYKERSILMEDLNHGRERTKY